MANVVRAKFTCTFETHKKSGPGPWQTVHAYEFMAIYDPDTPEDQRYAQTTPTGNLTIQVDNPDVSFEPGKAYYLDFTPAD